MAPDPAAMRRRARIMRAVNVPIRSVLGLPFPTPLGGGRWTLNLRDGRPVRLRLRGRDVTATPELVTEPAELERLLNVIARENPRAAKFVPIPRLPDGHLEPQTLTAALDHGFCIVRWKLPAQ